MKAPHSIRRIFLVAMAAGYAVFALVAISAILLPPWAEQGRVLASSFAIASYSLLALLLALLAERVRRPAIRVGAIVASVIAAMIALAAIWSGNPAEIAVRAMMVLTVFSVWALHDGALDLAKPRLAWVRAARGMAKGCAALLGLYAIAWFALPWEVMRPFSPEEEGWWQALSILSILVALGTIVVPIGMRLQRAHGEQEESGLPSTLRVAMTCPRCGAACLIAPRRPDRCGACGLEIEVRVEEPRCACGYLFHRLEGDACPECGRAIPESARWRGAITQ